MESLIEKIVIKLQKLPVSHLEKTLAFVDLLHRQNNLSVLPTDGDKSDVEVYDTSAEWQAFVNEYSGIWPDFPVAEEPRASLGQDVPRMPF